ncbi:hypothetical protein, partial [Mycobacterium sp. 1274756.6]|uniref:hypothetical protein n=1 Tax=Mycobacterium sp. 1274756.6 TaxID=1834076 RepID=UPI000A607552
MTTDQNQRLSSLDFWDEDEHTQLFEWGNRSALAEPLGASATIPGLFGVQVARAPGAVALRCGGVSWTYQQLDEASN